MVRKWSEIRKGPPSIVKSLTPEIAERLARLDKFCEGMSDEAQFDLLELGHRYTAEEITFAQFKMGYWQTRPIGERIEETWRLSVEEAFREAAASLRMEKMASSDPVYDGLKARVIAGELDFHQAIEELKKHCAQKEEVGMEKVLLEREVRATDS
jgi:hypothetical protein